MRRPKRIKIPVMLFAVALVIWTSGVAFGAAFSMRLTTDTPETMPQGIAANWFSEEIKKVLPDSEVKVYNASSLHNNTDSLEAMYSGTLEACWATLSKILGILPSGLCLRMPSLFSTYEQVQKIPQTEIGSFIAQAADKKGFVLLSWGNVSPYIGIGSRKRILTPADWQGKKVRVYEKVTQLAMVKIMGGNPIPMPWGEFVPSVQSGVVDAGFTSLGSWNPVKETLPYLTSIGMMPDYYVFLVAKRWWNGLDSKTRETVNKVAVAAGKKQMTLQFERDQADARKFVTKDPAAMGCYLLTDAELAPYKEKWVEPIRKLIEKEIGKEGPQALEMVIRISKELK